MQPYFFPYLGYFQLISAADKFILYDNVNYIKKGWIHRNRIREKGRDTCYCAVPVKGASSFMKINEVQVDGTQRWPGKFLDLLAFNYRKARYFAGVYPVIAEVVNRKATYLSDVNYNTISALVEYLAIDTALSYDNSQWQPFEDAIRTDRNEQIIALRAQQPDLEDKTLRVLYICRQEQANTYLNPIGGQALYSKDTFAHNGISLQFVKSNIIPYDQFGAPFIANLSIIDVLMHCGKEGTQRMLKEYTLI